MGAVWDRSRVWLKRQLLQPFSNGILGFATTFAVFFSLFLLMLFPMGVGEMLVATARVNGSTEGIEALAHSTGYYQLFEMLANETGFSILEVSLTLLGAVAALVTTFMMAFVGWMWVATISTVAFIGHALNGQSISKWDIIKVALNSGTLLALLLVLYGLNVWLFAVWEAVLLCGVVVAAWRLRYPAKREFFGVEARTELEAAQQMGKSLGVILLIVSGIMMSGHSAIAALPEQWILLLIIVSAGLLLWYILLIEDHVKKAISIALHDRDVNRIRNRGA